MARYLAFLTLAVLMHPPTAPAQQRWQARSMVISRRGIVATSQTLASQAGAQVLARGGSAMDAAIAANAVLGVVEPMMNGIGGDLFVIHRDGKTGKLSGINASGWSPQALTNKVLDDKGHYSMPQDGIHSVTVPGCVDGWEKLHKRFGRLGWAENFEPAIHFAREGFPVTEIIQETWESSESKLRDDENGRTIYLKNGNAPKLGEVFRNPQLAKALELIAKEGAKAFYQGAIAKSILRTFKRLGGVLSAEDLAEYQSEWVEPIHTTYRGWKVYELPPNGQGLAALSMLNIMEQFPLREKGPLSADAFHLKIEAQKLAYADLKKFVGDPRFAPVPVEELISKKYAATRAALVKADTARCAPDAGNPFSTAGDTIYLSVVDAEGNVVSLIQSIYLSFGSGVVVDDFGFHLHNRGGLFVLEDGHPNELKPRKRPFHTIIPGYMEKGSLHVGFGIMGGLNQAQAHAQFISNVVDHEMNLQGALEAPRFTKMNFSGCDVMLEDRLPAETLATLRDRGHYVQMQGPFSSWMGGGQAVMHDSKAKVNYGASSPRKDGAAVPEPEGFAAPSRRR
ncbi:MAG: gamma-glutamyltransferase [Acidimicrobiia bacterium]|nr:gamma-glutamyltransferase [Acidimicrobiia bacterium]